MRAVVNPWLVRIAGWLLPKTIFGLRTAVLLGGSAKIKAVIDLLKQAGMDEKEAKATAAIEVAKNPTADADRIAREAWENRGSSSGQ